MSDEQNKTTSPHSRESGDGSVAEESENRVDEASTYTVEKPYDYQSHEAYSEPALSQAGSGLPAVISAEPPPPLPPASGSSDEDEDDDEGMLRMSFLEHLEELRVRIIRSVIGLAIAFFVCFTFKERLWAIVQEPASIALKNLGYKDASLVFTSPMESFTIIWMKLPLLLSLFVGSPWILYQTWGFIAPGLYSKERRLAFPFVLSTAGLFILGGLFGYFVAFRFGLEFLLGIGGDVGVRPMITITDYFDIFVNVILGVAVVFELPVLIFFLTLLRVASPKFLLENSRYAILGIFLLAAVITPTPDVFNLMLFAVPMVALFFIGIFASYLLVMSREGKKIPWGRLLLYLALVAAICGGIYWGFVYYQFHFSPSWPYLVR